MVSQARSQCKTMLVNKALVQSVRRHHARVTHQIMLLVLSSAGALGAKGSNEEWGPLTPSWLIAFLNDRERLKNSTAILELPRSH